MLQYFVGFMLVYESLSGCGKHYIILQNHGKFCAFLFMNSGSTVETSCGGKRDHVEIMEHTCSLPRLRYNHKQGSSLMVKPGCEVKAFDDINCSGHSRIFSQGITHDLNKVGWNDKIASMQCYCQSEFWVEPKGDPLNEIPSYDEEA